MYDNNPANVKVGQQLPPGCSASTCVAATYNGSYPYVFNNVLVDDSFGITSKIYLDQVTPFGFVLSSYEVPNSQQRGISAGSNQLVTSFSSKSEIGLHLSTDGRLLSFMGYVTPVDTIDASNSNTPLAVDSTNPVVQNVYRAAATVNSFGQFTYTETNAYSGNNGRSAILNNKDGLNVFYTAGNAGNGSNPQPLGIVLGAGAQIIDQTSTPESFQTPGNPTPVASFSVTQLGDKADKVGKDDNFRGMTIFNNVLYYTKGSGSNGVNTVYFVDTTGTACPKGVGLPVAGAPLPTSPLAYNASTVATSGLPSNMCILAGFNTTLAKTTTNSFPFGLWFADANTLYVADEGDGYTSGGTLDLYAHAAAQTTAGLQKWVFNSTTQTWNLAYTLTNGLGIGTPYTVKGYPTGNNPATTLPWAPTTDGLRNITGVAADGYAVIYAITSTTSGGGDTGADPNRLVAIVDRISNTDAIQAANERFTTVRSAAFAEVLRGVSFTPGSW